MKEIDTYSCISRALIPLPQLAQPRFLLLSQVRVLLNLGLVESIDNRVLARYHMYALDLGVVSVELVTHNHLVEGAGRTERGTITYLLVILEPNLTNSHAPVLLQVRPWRVNNCDVVLLVTCELSTLLSLTDSITLQVQAHSLLGSRMQGQHS